MLGSVCWQILKGVSLVGTTSQKVWRLNRTRVSWRSEASEFSRQSPQREIKPGLKEVGIKWIHDWSVWFAADREGLGDHGRLWVRGRPGLYTAGMWESFDGSDSQTLVELEAPESFVPTQIAGPTPRVSDGAWSSAFLISSQGMPRLLVQRHTWRNTASKSSSRWASSLSIFCSYPREEISKQRWQLLWPD